MKTWLALILPLTVFGTDHFVDLTPTIVYPQIEDKSSFELDYRIVNDFASGYTIVNPRFKPMGLKDCSTSLGIGHRIELDSGLFGFHLYTDHSFVSGCHFLQLGPSLEFLSSKWEVRFNGYFPVYQFKQPKFQIVTPHNYFDSELVYKWKFADLGLSHNFDMKTRKNGVVGRISVPLGVSTVTLSGGTDGIHGKHVKLALAFDFPPGVKSNRHQPVSRQTGLVYDTQKVQPKPKPVKAPVFVSAPIVVAPKPAPVVQTPVIQMPVEAVIEEPILPAMENPILPVIEKPIIPVIEKKPDPHPKGWTDFFFNGQRPRS
jgi:hypothetical protein